MAGKYSDFDYEDIERMYEEALKWQPPVTEMGTGIPNTGTQPPADSNAALQALMNSNRNRTLNKQV